MHQQVEHLGIGLGTAVAQRVAEGDGQVVDTRLGGAGHNHLLGKLDGLTGGEFFDKANVAGVEQGEGLKLGTVFAAEGLQDVAGGAITHIGDGEAEIKKGTGAQVGIGFDEVGGEDDAGLVALRRGRGGGGGVADVEADVLLAGVGTAV